MSGRVLVVAAVLSCGNAGSLPCLEAAAKLAQCCPGFDRESVVCTAYDSGCGHRVGATLGDAEAECILGESCDQIRAADVCARETAKQRPASTCSPSVTGACVSSDDCAAGSPACSPDGRCVACPGPGCHPPGGCFGDADCGDGVCVGWSCFPSCRCTFASCGGCPTGTTCTTLYGPIATLHACLDPSVPVGTGAFATTPPPCTPPTQPPVCP